MVALIVLLSISVFFLSFIRPPVGILCPCLCCVALAVVVQVGFLPAVVYFFLQKVLEDKKPFDQFRRSANASNIVGHVDCCATTKLNVSSDNTSWEIFSSHGLK